MSENYIIKKETLTATADAIRSHIGSTPTFKSEVAGEDNMLATEVNVYYVEYIDENYGGYGLNEGADGTDAFIAYGYLADNNGIITPVLYKTDIDTEYQDPDYYEPFFYVGLTQIDGVDYNKWRKIELGDENGTEGEITWESSMEKYVYTDIIVNDSKISPVDFPSKIDEVYEAGLANGGIQLERGKLTLTVTNNHANNASLILMRSYLSSDNVLTGGRVNIFTSLPSGETSTASYDSVQQTILSIQSAGGVLRVVDRSGVSAVIGSNTNTLSFALTNADAILEFTIN